MANLKILWLEGCVVVVPVSSPRRFHTSHRAELECRLNVPRILSRPSVLPNLISFLPSGISQIFLYAHQRRPWSNKYSLYWLDQPGRSVILEGPRECARKANKRKERGRRHSAAAAAAAREKLSTFGARMSLLDRILAEEIEELPPSSFLSSPSSRSSPHPLIQSPAAHNNVIM